MFVVCWSSQQIKHYIRKRVSKQTDFCQQFACGFNLFADIMQTMSQAMSQCVQKYMCNFLVTESRNLSSPGHFSQSTEINIDTMSVLFILLSAWASGELAEAETRSWGEEQEHSGAEVLVYPTQWSVLVLGTASPHIHCDKSQNSLTMTLSTLSYWNFLF